jgi:hypothetical protein
MFLPAPEVGKEYDPCGSTSIHSGGGKVKVNSIFMLKVELRYQTA